MVSAILMVYNNYRLFSASKTDKNREYNTFIQYAYWLTSVYSGYWSLVIDVLDHGSFMLTTFK